MAAEETNFYHPDGDDGADQSPTAKEPKPDSISWTASQFIEHNLGVGWYLVLLAVTIVLAAAVYFMTHDYFAVGIIIVLGIIMAFYAGHKPDQVTFEVNGKGLKIDDKPYAYGNFKSFSIIHEGALSTITFYPIKRLSLPISIFFDAKDEDRIVSLIGDHLPLENRGPDRFDTLTRRLKL